MFQHLLELLFHAKAGALAGIILIGTTGALVTATVSSSNGVTTITLTQASASPSGSASPSHSPSATPTHSASPTHSSSPTPAAAPAASDASSSASACSDDAHAMSDAVKTVNAAFSKYHTDLMHMRDSKSDAAKKIVDDADKLLKTLRQNAVKDIHATSSCAKAEGDDEDTTDDKSTDQTDENDNEQNDDNDKSEKSSEKNFVVILFNNLFGRNTTTTTASKATTNNTTTNTTLTLTTTGDAKAIADAAVAAMKLVFDDATAKLKAVPSASPKATKSPRPVSPDTKGKQNSGKSNSRSDREGDD